VWFVIVTRRICYRVSVVGRGRETGPSNQSRGIVGNTLIAPVRTRCLFIVRYLPGFAAGKLDTRGIHGCSECSICSCCRR
jgi:hypothetical protein